MLMVKVLMPLLVIGMQNKGFTLIEILVVLLIIGITLGFALLAFGDFGAERKLRVSAEQFVNYLKFAQQEAILEACPLGIRINKAGYQILRFQAPSSWTSIPHNHLFKLHPFPEHAIIELQSPVKSIPQIRINDEGEISPFKLSFGTTAHPDLLFIMGSSDNRITIQRPQSP